MNQITALDKLQSTMCTFVHSLLEKAHTFSVLDFAIFKTCLVCFGAWIAATFAKPARKLKPFFFIAFLLSWAYLIWRIFLQCDHSNTK